MIESLPDLMKLVLFAGAVYGGIRADIKAIHRAVAEAQTTANAAHSRIDALLLKEIK